jgi:hypothetical protein
VNASGWFHDEHPEKLQANALQRTAEDAPEQQVILQLLDLLFVALDLLQQLLPLFLKLVLLLQNQLAQQLVLQACSRTVSRLVCSAAQAHQI